MNQNNKEIYPETITPEFPQTKADPPQQAIEEKEEQANEEQKKLRKTDKKWLLIILIILIVSSLAAASYAAYQNMQLKKDLANIVKSTQTPISTATPKQEVSP
jgi:flagellar basal body-associated protein FliL